MTNAQKIEQLIEGLNAMEFSAWLDILDPDCKQNLPYAPEGFPTTFAPRDKIIAHFEEAFAKRASVHFYDVLVTAAADDNIVFAEFKQDSPIPGTKGNYTQIYIHKFIFKDGKVVQWDEYFDPLRVLNAFGGLEKALEMMAAK